MSKLFSKNHQQTTLEETQEEEINTSYYIFLFLAAFYQLTYQHDSKDFNICNYKTIYVYIQIYMHISDLGCIWMDRL